MSSNAPVYSSRNLPPDVGAERFHDVVKTIPAARKMGRTWIVPVDDWNAARTIARGGAR